MPIRHGKRKIPPLRNVRRLREAAGLSLRTLEELSGVAYRVIFALEHGERDPRLGTLRRLARALGVSVGDLVDEEAARGRASSRGRR